ncbi:UNVERIFIED_CONTAM: hypothetical protein GTU68_015223 [Idotea baltica]|nr:hypothetical protein [Idotea baltica]
MLVTKELRCHFSFQLYYGFSYEVKDEEQGTDFRHQETRDGNYTEGLYTVMLPDTRLMTVTYYVDEQSGFVADIVYEGEAQYPEEDASGSSTSDSRANLVARPLVRNPLSNALSSQVQQAPVQPLVQRGQRPGLSNFESAQLQQNRPFTQQVQSGSVQPRRNSQLLRSPGNTQQLNSQSNLPSPLSRPQFVSSPVRRPGAFRGRGFRPISAASTKEEKVVPLSTVHTSEDIEKSDGEITLEEIPLHVSDDADNQLQQNRPFTPKGQSGSVQPRRNSQLLRSPGNTLQLNPQSNLPLPLSRPQFISSPVRRPGAFRGRGFRPIPAASKNEEKVVPFSTVHTSEDIEKLDGKFTLEEVPLHITDDADNQQQNHPFTPKVQSGSVQLRENSQLLRSPGNVQQQNSQSNLPLSLPRPRLVTASSRRPGPIRGRGFKPISAASKNKEKVVPLSTVHNSENIKNSNDKIALEEIPSYLSDGAHKPEVGQHFRDPPTDEVYYLDDSGNLQAILSMGIPGVSFPQ